MKSSLYPVRFADYRNTSFCPVTAPAEGKKQWFLSTADAVHRSIPLSILLHNNALVLQYADRIEYVDHNGKRQWRSSVYPGFFSAVTPGGILVRTSPSGLSAVNEKNEITLRDFFVPNTSERGRFDFVVPFGKNYCIQTFTPAEEPVDGEEHGKNSYSFMLMGPNSYDDWVYLHEQNGSALPALLTSDGTKAVLAATQSTITVYDIATGTGVVAVESSATEFLRASLDGNNNVITLLRTSEGKNELRAYPLAGEKTGKPAWSCGIPGGPVRPFCQPPAIDGNNRAYVIMNNRLHAVEQDKILWEAAIPPSTNFQYITILGDNTVLCASSNTLSHLIDGEQRRFVFILPEGEEITTPPVVDESQRIYFGTASGIYCIR